MPCVVAGGVDRRALLAPQNCRQRTGAATDRVELPGKPEMSFPQDVCNTP